MFLPTHLYYQTSFINLLNIIFCFPNSKIFISLTNETNYIKKFPNNLLKNVLIFSDLINSTLNIKWKFPWLWSYLMNCVHTYDDKYSLPSGTHFSYGPINVLGLIQLIELFVRFNFSSMTHLQLVLSRRNPDLTRI